jgi:hypothetical protein
MAYSDEQINDFLEVAQEVGITRAKRELGYPKSWGTAQRWAELRGVTVAVDEIKAVAAAVREAYKDEDVMVVVTEGFNRVYEEITTKPELTADDLKKLSEAANKFFNMYASIKGKATSITENRQTDSMDQHLEELLAAERAKNILRKENVTDQ